MDADAWSRLALTLISSPEKMALGLVIAVGAWRWIRELVREARGAVHEETLVEMLLRENRDLREELRRRRDDDRETHDE